MSRGMRRLHSHSGLERNLGLPKNVVIVDLSFENLFLRDLVQPFYYHGSHYLKVPIELFIKAGGVFKNYTL